MTKTALSQELAKIHTSNYCIAYLDVLGAENFMKDDKEDKFLNDLSSIYTDALRDVIFTRYVTKKDIYTRIFSDNILLAIKINKNDDLRKDKIEKIINLAGNIYNSALYRGYLMRGAITEGLFYKDDYDIFVYGKALIDAVEIEKNIAIYPRVIAQKEIHEKLPQYFDECSDGYYTLNNFLFTGLISEDVYKHRLVEMYKKYHKDERVKQKIVWTITHFNSYYGSSRFVNKVQITKEELKEISEVKTNV